MKSLLCLEWKWEVDNPLLSEVGDSPVSRRVGLDYHGEHSIPTLRETGGFLLQKERAPRSARSHFLRVKGGIRPCPLEWEWSAISILKESG